MNKRGSLRKENRKLGKVWVLRYLKTREADQKRVESTVVIGSVKNFPSERSAWEEVGRQHLQLHRPNRVRKTFTDLAEHYILHELGDQADAAIPKSVNTIAANLRILRKRLIPNWGNRVAVAIEPLEIEGWLKSLRQSEQLENPTLHKARSVMSLVYKSAQRYGLISRQREANPLHFVRCQTQSEYEAITCSLEQVRLILAELEKNGRHLERLVALVAIATGLRISECLGLQWQDVDCAGQRMFVRRTWIRGNVGKPKTKASRATVPMHLMLALEMLQWHKQSPWAVPTDWVFASERMGG
jgi:integrase